MNPEHASSDAPTRLDRRELLAYTAAFGTTFLAAQGLAAAEKAETSAKQQRAAKRYEMKKSINLWALPYPQTWSLEDCFRLAKQAGFDGVEVNFALDGELSAETSDAGLEKIGKLARKIGIEISGVCSFLYWPYSLTANDERKRSRGLELGLRMIRAAQLLGTENLLVVPGAVYIPWLKEAEPVPNDVCWERATKAIREMIPAAEKAGVSLNLENIFANAFLMSPAEMNQFVDQFQSPQVQIHFDTGNIMEYQFPEHWVPILGKRIKNTHLKEFDKANSFNLDAFRLLLDGTTNWPAVIETLDAVGYRGYLTFEYFHPLRHYPAAMLYQTSDALDRMLGRK